MKADLLGLVSIVTLGALIIPATGHALTSEIVRCTTPDGQYQITVLDNQGTSFERSSHMSATIKFKNGVVVASYPVQRFLEIGSVSFTRPTFVDIATNGAQFKIAGASTNARNYIFAAQTSTGPMANDSLDCSRFSGVTF